jgi:SAM-dependent methyltransferase
LLQEGVPVPFLVELGVMNKQGKVFPQKRDKFRQINRFLEMVEDTLIHFEPSSEMQIIDFGCGKAYLTFALYHYLKWIKKYPFKIVGLDLKKEVIEMCQKLARQFNYQDLEFVFGDINHYQASNRIDMVISLHACDTATDAILEKAIHWGAKVILSVPCCQHELFSQVKNPLLIPILKHGILKERFAALATDAARAQLLEVFGYQTQLLEFIDIEHTPKNILIRAIKTNSGLNEAAWKSYLSFKQSLQIDPSLERRLIQELKNMPCPR